MSDNESKKTDLVKVSALWKKKQANGKTYLSGNFGDAFLLIFENLDKLKENANPSLPDYNMYVKRQDASKYSQKPKTEGGTFKADYLGDDDIPF